MHFNGVYDQPLVRLGPYIFGIFFGCFLCSNNRKLSFNLPFKVAGNLLKFSFKFVAFDLMNFANLLGWLICAILCALLMIGPFYINLVTNPVLKSGFLIASHSLWALVLVWICFASAAGFGGENFFRSLENFSAFKK